jgi:8-oxo-dGTP pyrophosphatase MutT (NUDIX family)
MACDGEAGLTGRTRQGAGVDMITNRDILGALTAYLERFPEEAAGLSEPARILSGEADCASRRTFPMHATAGALLTRGDTIMLVHHRAYGIVLQPGGHLEPGDITLCGAAERELVEETGIDPGAVFCVSRVPAYVEFGMVPARPSKDEPAHFHLDFGFAFATADGDIGRIQESEMNGARWYPLDEAEHLVGHRIGRAVSVPPGQLTRLQ